MGVRKKEGGGAGVGPERGWAGEGAAHTLSHLTYWISEKLCPAHTPQAAKATLQDELSATQSGSSGTAYELEGHGRDRPVTLRLLGASPEGPGLSGGLGRSGALLQLTEWAN